MEGGGVVADGGIAELSYPVSVVQRGDYKMRMKVKGDPAAPVSVELAPTDEVEAVKSFPVVPPDDLGLGGGGLHLLTPGSYSAKVLLPPGSQLDKLEVSPPCVNAIEPPGGWQPDAVAKTSDAAVTMLKALDAEDKLPPSELPIEVTGESFETDGRLARDAGERGKPRPALAARGARAACRPSSSWTCPRPGCTRSRASDAGRRPELDRRFLPQGVVCGSTASSDADQPAWKQALMTAELTAGRHVFTVTLGRGAGVERLRLQGRKTAPEDYVAAVRELGFEPGPDGSDHAREGESRRCSSPPPSSTSPGAETAGTWGSTPTC